nr:hypothetical protein [Tanacetum cinerariifolium]
MGRVGPQPFHLPPNLSHQKKDLHPELPGPKERIVDFSEGKVGVYTKFFEFANFRLPISQFLFDILGHYQIHLSQLSVIDMNLFNLIRASNPTKVKIGTRPRAAHEVPLLTVTASRVMEMEDPAVATESSGTTSTIERSPLDFANENPSQQSTRGDGTEDQGQETVALEVPPPENATTTGVAPEKGLVEEIAAMGPRVIKKRRKKGNDGVDANAPPKVLRKDHADSRPTYSTVVGKFLASMGLETGSTFPVPTPQETPIDVSDPDPLSFANPQSIPKQDVVQYPRTRPLQGFLGLKYGVEHGKANLDLEAIEAYDSEADTKYVAALHALRDLKYPMVDQLESLKDAPIDVIMASLHLKSDFGEDVSQWIRELRPSSSQLKIPVYLELRLMFEHEAKLLKKSVTQVARQDKRIQARENEIKNLEALLEAEADMKKVVKAKNKELVKELENLRAQFIDLQVSNDRLSQQVSTLQAQVTREEKLKATFEEFKKYKDDRVEKRCVEIDARLDALSIDFDEELYPHMLTAIACRR